MPGNAEQPGLLQAQLSQLARLAVVAEMASAMAHEINQPLTAIATYSSVLRRLIGTPGESAEQAREIAGEIGAQAMRAAAVVKRIRGLVGHSNFEPRPTDCNEAIQNLIDLAQPLASAHDVRIDLELAASLPPVLVDALQFQLLLWNIVQNSIEAIGGHQRPDRRITINSRIEGDALVEISVSDTGGGIPEAISVQLFKPFATTKANGTGLGLLACQRIAQLHGGQLQVDNRPGIGARLSVRLPTR